MDIDEYASLQLTSSAESLDIQNWTLINTATIEVERDAQEKQAELQATQCQSQDRPANTHPRAAQESAEEIIASYTYQPLPSCNWFRLLRLTCKRDSGLGIRGRLVPFVLDAADRPLYRAVSHTWGEGQLDHIILLEDRKLRVHQKLAELLEGVRDDEHDCWLWINAICIDQASQLEKGHQIKLMGDIYSKANSVLAWLGPDSAEIDHAFKVMSDAVRTGVHKYFDDQDLKALVYGKKGVTSTVWEYEWHCIARLLKLRYWTRRWIIQEVILARSVVLRAGRSQYAMKVIEDFFQQLQRDPYIDDKRMRYLENLFGETGLKHTHAALLSQHRTSAWHKSNQPSTLYELLWLYDRFECKEPSDLVYALYNLIGTHREHLNVDYDQPMTDRFIEVLSFMGEHEPAARPDLVRTMAMLLQQLGLDDRVLALHALNERSVGSSKIQTSIFDRREIKYEPESTLTIDLRTKSPALRRMPPVSFHKHQDTWQTVTENGEIDLQPHFTPLPMAGVVETTDLVSRHDMSCFTTTTLPVRYGLATVEICPTDRIWQFKDTNLAFVVRRREKEPEPQKKLHQWEGKVDDSDPSALEDIYWQPRSKRKSKKRIASQFGACEIVGRALIYDTTDSIAELDRGANLPNLADDSPTDMFLTYSQFFELIYWADLMG